jgi:HAD superfamily hydrolase (TIGR01509 family)
MNTPKLHAIIFDLDGTLVDSRLDFAAMRRELDAPADVGLLEFIDSLPSAESQAQAMDVVHKHELAGAEAATWMPGAEAVLHALHEREVLTAIVTRNCRRAAELTMARMNMPSIPLKAREDAAPKPDPEALLALASHWRMAPANCAYVGDFRYDIEAAQRAGMLPVLYLGMEEAPSTHDHRVPVLREFHTLLDWLDEGPALT